MAFNNPSTNSLWQPKQTPPPTTSIPGIGNVTLPDFRSHMALDLAKAQGDQQRTIASDLDAIAKSIQSNAGNTGELTKQFNTLLGNYTKGLHRPDFSGITPFDYSGMIKPDASTMAAPDMSGMIRPDLSGMITPFDTSKMVAPDISGISAPSFVTDYSQVPGLDSVLAKVQSDVGRQMSSAGMNLSGNMWNAIAENMTTHMFDQMNRHNELAMNATLGYNKDLLGAGELQQAYNQNLLGVGQMQQDYNRNLLGRAEAQQAYNQNLLGAGRLQSDHMLGLGALQQDYNKNLLGAGQLHQGYNDQLLGQQDRMLTHNQQLLGARNSSLQAILSRLNTKDQTMPWTDIVNLQSQAAGLRGTTLDPIANALGYALGAPGTRVPGETIDEMWDRKKKSKVAKVGEYGPSMFSAGGQPIYGQVANPNYDPYGSQFYQPY